MTLKLKHLCVAVVASLSAFVAQADPAASPRCGPLPASFTLATAVERAICANPELQGYRFEVQAAQASEDKARAAYLPSVSAGYSAQRLDAGAQSSHHVALNWLLTDFGAREATLAAAKAGKSAVTSQASDQAQALALSVAQTYFEQQAAQAGVIAAMAQEAASREALKLATARHKAGEAIKLDVLQAQSALAQATVARTKAEAQLKTHRAYLAMLLAVPAEQAPSLALEEPSTTEMGTGLPSAALADLVRQARLSRHDLKAGRAQVEALRLQADAARAEHLPTISLVGNLGRTNPAAGRNMSSNNIGISVSIPIFSGGATSAQVRSLTAQAGAQQQRLQAAENRAGYDVVATYQTVLSSVEQLSAASTLAESARAAEVQSIARYRAGVGTMLEVFDSLSKRASAEETLISSRLGLQLARAQLARSLGQMPLR